MSGGSFVIPLVAVYGPSSNNNLYPNQSLSPSRSSVQILTLASSNAVIVEAAANYIKAENEFLLQKPNVIVQGPAASLDFAKQITAKYSYVVADEATGRLGVLADAVLAAAGDLALTIENQNLIVTNAILSRSIPYKDYGSAGIPLAVNQNSLVNTVLPPYTEYALIRNQDVARTNLELVAQTAIINRRIEENNRGEYVLRGPTSVRDANQFSVPTELNSTDIVFPQTTGVNQLANNFNAADFASRPNLPPDFILEASNNARKASGYLEDAGSVTSLPNLEQLKANNQTMNLARSEAGLQSAITNPTGGSSVDMPTSSSTQTPNNSVASNPNYKTQEQKTQNISSNGVNRNISPTQAKVNPLHDYTNYTYSFTIYAVPRTTINKIANGEINPGNEEEILAGGSALISSGGAAGLPNRSPLFGVDFYIDNLQLTSIVGQGARSRGTDVIEFSFDIIEPYNTTLLPRLIGESYRITGKPDFGMMFFVMRIDFFGYDDFGQPNFIPNTGKFLPFQMIKMDFEVANRGTIYKVKGIPVNHVAQTILDNTVPFHMEISGGTINEIFNGDAAVVATSSASNQRSDTAASSAVKSGPKTYSKGVKQALDEGEKYLVTTKAQTFPNTYSFDFRDGIGDKKVVDPQVYRTQGFRMSDNKKAEELNPATTKLDPSKNTIRIQAGSKITDLINNVLQVSEYYTGQFVNERRPNKPLFFHKIIPLVKFGELDPRTNLYKRDITYVIKPYTMHGSDKENFGQKAPNQTVKRFQWIYTGQNRDIIDFKLQYQMAFFELRNGADKAMVAEGEGDEANANDGAGGSGDEFGVLDTGVFPRRVRPVFGIADQNNSGAKDRSIKTLKLEELFKKQFDTAGDLISLDLTIVGDPDLIQQDNILYGANTNTNQLVYDSGSVNFADHEAYFFMEFKNPITDYNDSTGLFNLNDEETNFFSGFYRIIQVKSQFRQGKFTQTLQNYRVRRQSDSQNSDTVRSNTDSSQPKAEPASGKANVTTPAATLSTAEQATANVRSAPDQTAALIANNPQSTAGTPAQLATGTPLG